MSKIFFDKIPVVNIDDEIEKEFTSLICDIQNEYTQDKAIHIDKRIFDLYKLSNHEREIIGFVEIS